jgi:hypothetical protein
MATMATKSGHRQDLSDLSGRTVRSNCGTMIANLDGFGVHISSHDGKPIRSFDLKSQIMEMVWSSNGRFIAIRNRCENFRFQMITVFQIATGFSFFSEKYQDIRFLRQWGCNNFTFYNQYDKITYLGHSVSRFHSAMSCIDSETMDPCDACHNTSGCNSGGPPIYSDSEYDSDDVGDLDLGDLDISDSDDN